MNSISVYILAGGKSSRMGEDKGLKLLNNKPMIEYSIETLRSYFLNTSVKRTNETIKIISNNLKYKEFGLEVIEDYIKDKGPLGGIYTALKDTSEDSALIISCDIPFITEKALEDIICSYNNEKIIVAGNDQRIQPLFGIYSKEILSRLKENIENNRLKMINFLTENKVKVIEIEDTIFRNINTPEEFNEASKSLRL